VCHRSIYKCQIGWGHQPPKLPPQFFLFFSLPQGSQMSGLEKISLTTCSTGTSQTTTIDRGIRDTSRQISFEFLFLKTCPPDKLHNGFRRGIEWRNQTRYVICQGGKFWLSPYRPESFDGIVKNKLPRKLFSVSIHQKFLCNVRTFFVHRGVAIYRWLVWQQLVFCRFLSGRRPDMRLARCKLVN
jgi:hypothetical protein